MSGPARITIEIEPTRQPGRWVTRTRVEERRSSRSSRRLDASAAPGAAEGLRRWRDDGDAATAPAQATSVDTVFVHVPEPREPAVVPAPYEPPTDCTCVDGWCEADHEND